MHNRVLPLLLILCLLLCACQKQPAAEGLSEPLAESNAVSENTVILPAESASSPESGESTPDSNGNPSAAKQTADSTPKSDTGANGVPAPPENQDVQPPAVPPKQNTVSLTVDCKNAIDYGILENPNFAGVLPQNGVIFSDANVQFTEGESVMKVLKRALKSQKTVCQITSGGYIVSIGGLAEKDCGETSGWLYRVNGELPNVSCKYYTLQAGDRVEFIYTCRMGDVGAY